MRQPSSALHLLLLPLTALMFGVGVPAHAAGESAKKAAPTKLQVMASQSSCVRCHSQQRFLVTHPRLYHYFLNWKDSIHAQEGVTCVDCHGGNPKASSMRRAHAGKGPGGVMSAVNYKNIPATCAKCHSEVADSFRKSVHYRHLVAKGQERQGPNCVTCHGAMNTSVLNVNDVKAACARCHNNRTKNHPEIPGKAETILGEFLSVHRYTRYIALQSKPEDLKATFEVVDKMVHDLDAEWHTFDLKSVEVKTRKLLKFLKEQRQEIRKGNTPKEKSK
jgi:formate-dependent nitrite reductase cytochrome c552 subunit